VDDVAGTDRDLLAAILQELRAIRVAIERETPVKKSKLSRADRDALTKFLPAIGGAFGSELFFAADVIESESAAVRLVRGKLTSKQLGRLLKRAVGVPVGGYVVTTDGEEAGSLLWRVKQVVRS
jgi:hypothetical protein